jgi:hypothetical protein
VDSVIGTEIWDIHHQPGYSGEPYDELLIEGKPYDPHYHHDVPVKAGTTIEWRGNGWEERLGFLLCPWVGCLDEPIPPPGGELIGIYDFQLQRPAKVGCEPPLISGDICDIRCPTPPSILAGPRGRIPFEPTLVGRTTCENGIWRNVPLTLQEYTLINEALRQPLIAAYDLDSTQSNDAR